MKIGTTAASLVLSLGLAGTAMAQGFGGLGGEPSGGPGALGGGRGVVEQAVLMRALTSDRLAAELKLTDEQKQTLRNGLFDIQEQKIKLRADLELAGIQQARLLTADKVDEKAVMEAVEKTGAVHTEMAKTEIRGLLLVRNTLNAEQRQQVRQLIHKHMERNGTDGQRGQGQANRGEHQRGTNSHGAKTGPDGQGGPGGSRVPPPAPEQSPQGGDVAPQ